MAQGYTRTKITYQLGWVAAVVALVFKLLQFTRMGTQISDATRINPHNFLQASVLLFLICIANEAYASACLRKGAS